MVATLPGQAWHPDVTVATVVALQGRLLLVEERIDGQLVLNQPAGHLEPGESLVEAAVRETLEETGWQVRICQAVQPAGAGGAGAAGAGADGGLHLHPRLNDAH